MAELHQLVHEVGASLGVEIEPPAVYQRHLEAVVYYATTRETPVEPSVTLEPTSRAASSAPSVSTSSDEYTEADEVITQHCEREWPDDYSMRSYCIDQQRQAVAQLRRGGPADIPMEIFRQIRRKCAREWPDDYSMRLYSEEQQIAAYRKVRPSEG